MAKSELELKVNEAREGFLNALNQNYWKLRLTPEQVSAIHALSEKHFLAVAHDAHLLGLTSGADLISRAVSLSRADGRKMLEAEGLKKR